MNESNRLESARFGQASDDILEKLEQGVDTLLSKNAAKGFPMPTGPTLDMILLASDEAKGKLVEANGKIYEERRGMIFQQREFMLKILVRISKLALEAYREAILNALALEQKEVDSLRELDRADVDRLNAETEARQIAMVRSRAEMEQRITVYKQQQIAAETGNLELEKALIYAQLATAEKKLEIINSIYQVLAAEKLVLAAEQRRAASLALVLEAHQELAKIKEEMIPFYIQKAEARGELATAITLDTEVQKQIVALGYDRIDLKTAEEYAKHLLRQANEEYELAKEGQVRAETATSLARQEARRLLQEYSNQIRAEILEKKLALEQDGVDFKLNTQLARTKIGIDDEAEVLGNEYYNLTRELQNLLANMTTRTLDQEVTLRDSGTTMSVDMTTSITSRRIAEGVWAGVMPTGEFGG